MKTFMHDFLLKRGIITEQGALKTAENAAAGVNGAAPVAQETRSNEVMHQTNTGYGAEWIPAETWSTEFIDIVPAEESFLSLLPGNFGVGLPKTLKAPARKLSVGRSYMKKKGEWTTGRSTDAEAKHTQSKFKTPIVTINQYDFIFEVDVSDEELRHSPVGVEQYIREEIGKTAVRTIQAFILNGDTTTGGTGNVNSDDGAPDAESYYLHRKGLRRTCLDGSYATDLGTLEAADYLTLIGKLGAYGSRPSDMLFIQQNGVTIKALGLDQFALASSSADKAAIQSGRRPTPYGVDMLNSQDLPLTEADGKVSVTPGNNTKGSVLALYKPAVQYGFGKTFTLEVERVVGYGYRFVATMEFGFDLVDLDASLAEPTAWYGYNVTI